LFSPRRLEAHEEWGWSEALGTGKESVWVCGKVQAFKKVQRFKGSRFKGSKEKGSKAERASPFNFLLSVFLKPLYKLGDADGDRRGGRVADGGVKLVHAGVGGGDIAILHGK